MSAKPWHPNLTVIAILAPFILALAGYAISQSNDVAVLKANNAVLTQQVADLDKRLDRFEGRQVCK